MPLSDYLVVERARIERPFSEEEQQEHLHSLRMLETYHIPQAVHLQYEKHDQRLPTRLEVPETPLESITGKNVEVLLYDLARTPGREAELAAFDYLIVGARLEDGHVIMDNCRRFGRMLAETQGGTPQEWEIQASSFLYGLGMGGRHG